MPIITPEYPGEFSFVLKPATTPEYGIGVFAMHALDPGVDITAALFPRGYDSNPRHESEIPPHFIQYCVGRPDGMWLAPERFNAMDTGWRLNHSTTPNVLHGDVEGPDGQLVGLTRFVIASGGVAAGGELFIDYAMLGEPPEVQKDYYRRNP